MFLSCIEQPTNWCLINCHFLIRRHSTNFLTETGRILLESPLFTAQNKLLYNSTGEHLNFTPRLLGGHPLTVYCSPPGGQLPVSIPTFMDSYFSSNNNGPQLNSYWFTLATAAHYHQTRPGAAVFSISPVAQRANKMIVDTHSLCPTCKSTLNGGEGESI